MGFTLSLVVFFLLVRFVLPQVLRAVLGGFVRQQVHKAQQGGFYPPGAGQPAGGGYQGQAQQEPTTKPGQVRVDYVPPTTSAAERKHEFRGGEYVDYEEVK
ncbi:DUF4834 family protein [Hymenobacter sp. UV11]|uniref:DUF4834 family protein n=1 Tax=Hymenobacter sp. UV11 TaxID=1849735 RepID=UPI0010607394|nr:DUF4834 family protein [Hymenobacter sp. UV11]TDN37368.1 hypothetical protein A8B98_02160 [Hymenobacter sp. UV11]TFZ68554.1 DUF4834 family protein [Hymenobacter sp. UV11]